MMVLFKASRIANEVKVCSLPYELIKALLPESAICGPLEVYGLEAKEARGDLMGKLVDDRRAWVGKHFDPHGAPHQCPMGMPPGLEV